MRRSVRGAGWFEVGLRIALVGVSVVSFSSYGGSILATGPLLGIGYVWVIRRAGPVSVWGWLALSIPLASLWGWTLGYVVLGHEVGWLPWTVAILWGSFVSVLIPVRHRGSPSR